MSGRRRERRGIIAYFPGKGNLFAPFNNGESLAEFKQRLQDSYNATYQQKAYISALLHPDYLPEEVVLPMNAGAVKVLCELPSVVAKLKEVCETPTCAPLTRSTWRGVRWRGEAATASAAPSRPLPPRSPTLPWARNMLIPLGSPWQHHRGRVRNEERVPEEDYSEEDSAGDRDQSFQPHRRQPTPLHQKEEVDAGDDTDFGTDSDSQDGNSIEELGGYECEEGEEEDNNADEFVDVEDSRDKSEDGESSEEILELEPLEEALLPDAANRACPSWSRRASATHSVARQPPETLQGREVEMLASPVNPSVSAKQMTSIRLQKQIHQEMERKGDYMADLSVMSPSHRDKVAFIYPLLEMYGYSQADVYELLASHNFDMDLVQNAVDNIIHDLQGHEQGDWATHISRKHQREADLKRLRKHEIKYLEDSLGASFKELKKEWDTLDERPEVTPEAPAEAREATAFHTEVSPPTGKHERYRKQVSRLLEEHQSNPEADVQKTPAEILQERKRAWLENEDKAEAAAGIKEGRVVEETSVEKMSCSECRNLLLKMKSLVTTRVPLYLTLAKRAVHELVEFQPRILSDCQDVAFWELTVKDIDFQVTQRNSGATHTKRFAAKQFFQALNDCIFIASLPEMHPICIVYMLYTMQQAGCVASQVFHEAAQRVVNHVRDLDRDSLGKLVATFAAACIQSPGLFYVVAQECIRRCKLKEGPQCLSPLNLQDLFFAFGSTRVHNQELFEALMLRAVMLFDADIADSDVPEQICASVISHTGRRIPVQPLKLPAIIIILRALLQLNTPDEEFFEDCADYIIFCLRQRPRVADSFVGSPSLNLPEIAKLYVKAKVFHKTLFESFRLTAQRRRSKMTDWSLKALGESLKEQRNDETKKERQRSMGPPRKRGGVGRSTVKQVEEEKRRVRREQSRERRAMLEKLSDDEAARLAEPSDIGLKAKKLMAGLKAENVYATPEEAEVRGPRKAEVMEASLCYGQRNEAKKKSSLGVPELSSSAKARQRKGKK